mmetsp:Transcript_15680/g.41289  ORF Transcript_15680/g.41289 Transcript_15680/m.41289 type:complete len:210 (-) Transcript_15680:338-967(-)
MNWSSLSSFFGGSGFAAATFFFLGGAFFFSATGLGAALLLFSSLTFRGFFNFSAARATTGAGLKTRLGLFNLGARISATSASALAWRAFSSFACFCLRTYSWRSSMDILSRFGFSSGLGVDARALWDPGGSILGVFGRSVFDNKGSTETAEAAARSKGGNTHDLGVGAGSMISHWTSASTVSFVSVCASLSASVVGSEGVPCNKLATQS